ncbi:hypothetical protein RJ639_007451, partial [Escallonia herrerae]
CYIFFKALDKCQLGDVVRAKEEKIEFQVKYIRLSKYCFPEIFAKETTNKNGHAMVENGENWSVGQRQLFCLGRALLKKSRILVLDEATTSVDSATNGVLHHIISQEFKDRTIVTIAHRIYTVIDSDLVLVLSEGRVAEYDKPARPLERGDSLFSKLIKEYSMRSHSFNSFARLQD